MDPSNTSLRILLDAMPDPVLLVNSGGEIVFSGSRFEAVFGYTPGELIGSPLDKLIPECSCEKRRLHVDGFFREPTERPMGVDLDLQCRHRDGRAVPVEVSMSPLETNDGSMVLCVVRDVTTQRNLLNSLAAENAFSEGLIENTPAIVLLLDPAGRIIRINPFMEEVTGFRADEVAGKDWFRTFLPEEDWAPVCELFRDVLASGFNAGHVNPVITRDGTLRQINWSAKAVRNGDGQVVALLNVGFEITERLKQEEELAEACRMAEGANEGKSRFLAAASHDLRQPLQSVGMYLAVLSKQLECPDQQEIVGNIRSSLDIMSGLLDTFLDLSRLENGSIAAEKRDFNIRKLLDRILTDNLPTATEKGLRLCCDVSDCIVHSDPALLERIVENLVTNAIRYTSDGQVAIACREQGDAVQILVTDTGIGIPGDALDNIFDEYVQLGKSSKDRVKGLGLGLSIVKLLARLLDHPLEVMSEPGNGSTFSVIVPLGRAMAAAAKSGSTDRASTARKDRAPVVLLVDDDEAIVDSTTMLLESAGITVHSAGNGEDAMALAESGVCADLVITDYRLPRHSGVELVTQLRSIAGWPLPALLMTGDTSANKIARAGLSDCTVFRKPVDTERLIALVEMQAARSMNVRRQEQPANVAPASELALPLEMISRFRSGHKSQAQPLLVHGPTLMNEQGAE